MYPAKSPAGSGLTNQPHDPDQAHPSAHRPTFQKPVGLGESCHITADRPLAAVGLTSYADCCEHAKAAAVARHMRQER
jgi:hypothetical protein